MARFGERKSDSDFVAVSNTVAVSDIADAVNKKHNHTTATNNVQKFIATEGQTIFTAIEQYVPNTDNLWVFKNGLKLEKTTDYTESSINTFTLNTGCTAGDKITSIIFLSAVIEVF